MKYSTIRTITCFSWLLLGSVLVFGQSVSSSVNGMLRDSSAAAILGASCTLRNQATGAASRVSSGTDGLFTFPEVLAGTYTFRAEAPGFKALEVKDVVVSSREIRTLGNLVMQVGELHESVSVTAEAAALQLSSGEKSGIVTGTQLNELALKGRDLWAMMLIIPGVVDTNPSREAGSNSANRGIFINGSRDSQNNFSVDGMVDHDTHSNSSMAFEPNLDSIAEIKVLTSNYQAEYGRNSGGAVVAITKSGGQQFHGSAYDFYRHESLNATNFFGNRAGTQKPPYRYRITGYSLGGPVYIPGKFNANRDKLFFFWSQEFTGTKRDFGAKFANMPTALERNGDFSQSFNLNGDLILVKDPLTGRAFPGNIVPKNRISPLGQAILNFYPLPNFTDPDPRNRYRWNHRSVYSGGLPRRNDILRIDANVTSGFRVYYRYAHDRDNYLTPWDLFPARSGVNFLFSPVLHERAGLGHVAHVTKIFSPTLINETMVGFTMISRQYAFQDTDAVDRARMGNPPRWYQHPIVSIPQVKAVNLIPWVYFGGQPANTASIGRANNDIIPNSYTNPNASLANNLTKIWSKHSFKTGISIERVQASDPGGQAYRGIMDFSRDVNNPEDTGNSYSNALMGVLTSYSEISKTFPNHLRFWGAEWYVQDNWRVTRRLALDFGIRFYHVQPISQVNTNDAATFIPSLYDRSKAPALYVPALDPNGRRVAMDPTTGTLAIAPLIGQYVPGSGLPANGTVVGGVGAYPKSLYTRPGTQYGPRLGFAYDVFGDGKTALRGGWGWFYDTGQNNPFNSTVGNPPVAYRPQLVYGSLDTYAQTGGAIGPSSISLLFGRHRAPNTMNFSMGVQHQMLGTVFDVSYVGALSRNLLMVRNINPIPMHARFDPRNADPTNPGKPLPDNFLRPYYGWGDLREYQFSGTSNYNALQISITRRFTRGLQFGVAFTHSKVLGVASTDDDQVSPYFPTRQRNYGPLTFNRPNTLVFNYLYDLPRIGNKTGWKPATWILDNWQISGITSFTSGAPFTPGFSTVDGQDITGSTEGTRIDVAGNPLLAKSERTFFRNFNTDVFRRPMLRDFGNAGVNILHGPGINNWDISVSKRVPLFSENRFVQFRAELFNAWNHTQFATLDTTALFNIAGQQLNPTFGAFTSARTPRVIQLSLKIVF